ncbi:MAG TPA: LuxR C-terminal-related transcriptional regulator [Dehalococcoidia bacterium]|nr:LuxR C-terminal-related transcriptional regulator [Dehalococcoidia bacterium]
MSASGRVEPPSDALAAGRDALRRRDWAAALDHFARAAALEETPEALEGLAEAAWYLGDESQVFDGRERAYRLYLQRGDRQAAARVAVNLANDCIDFRGQPAVASGWMERARRLLEGLDPSPEQVWLATWDAHQRLMLANDAAAARARAREALRIARELRITDAEMVALAVEGLAAICEGHVADGMRSLDEAAAAALAGEVTDLGAAVSVFCYLVDACDRVRDFDRAAQWCDRVRTWGERMGWPEVFGACRPHYAVVLMWRGAWEEAERQLQASTVELLAFRPPMAVEAKVRLAELRWRQGRWDEAEALFREVEHDNLSQLGRAELALDRGDVATAENLVERVLRRIPPEDRIERAPALELKVRALADAGRPEDAALALQELQDIADCVRTDPLRASASLAAGAFEAARGAYTAAIACFEDAVDLYQRAGAAFEGARARIRLARALLRLGRVEAATQEAEAALRVFRRLSAAHEAASAERLLREAGGAGPEGTGTGAAGLTSREAEILALAAAGRSNREIADELVLSVRTVERHISNIYAKLGVTGPTARAAAVAFALRHGIVPS